ncbi:nucleotide disphospho-sugar-binding domain-containing protein [Sphingomonas xanthus]|uniref:Glycosyltransferase family 1 protein n=1 Tax=Sphingomonas xanthus TaxID=2594473 RepID=A0A516ITN6_9SPHN|nr:glycosyltransferase [Sphingomonas xanthus]QDP20263.1 glycosyltransferase family 1 protein [Sphingomonas xanthus]
MTTTSPYSFLVATWEGGGSVGPAVTVARKLRSRGHRVRLMSDRCNQVEADGCGLDFVAWTRAPSRPDRSKDSDVFRDWEVDTPPEQFQRVLDRIMAGPAQAFAEDILEELRREPADLVISSDMLLGVPIGCEAIGQKYAVLTANISLFPMEGVPPLGPGLAPAVTEEDLALHAEVAEGNRQLFMSGLPAVNRAREHFGLALLNSLEEQHDSAERIFLGTSRAFDFAPEQLPTNVRYVGPQLAEPSWVQPWQSPFDLDDRRPLILLAFSTSFQDHVGVLQRIIDAAANLPVRLLVTLGGTIGADELRPAANCRLVDSAPHDRVMPLAQLVITHGGHGTVTRSLVHGKPMIVVPHGRDQHDNAVRVTARGAGLALQATSSREEFEAAIRRMFDEPGFAEAAAELGDRVSREVAESSLIEELEQIAAGSRDALRAA